MLRLCWVQQGHHVRSTASLPQSCPVALLTQELFASSWWTMSCGQGALFKHVQVCVWEKERLITCGDPSTDVLRDRVAS